MKKYIAEKLLHYYGGIPKLPSGYGEDVQGPLTHKQFVVYGKKRLEKELEKGLGMGLDNKWFKPNEVTGLVDVCDFAFALDDWTDKNQSLEGYLDERIKRMEAEKTPVRMPFFNIILSNVSKYNLEKYLNGEPHKPYAFCGTMDDLFRNIKERRGFCIHDLPEHIQLNPEAAKAVLRENPTDICYLRPEMMDNLEVIEETVKHTEYANCIRYASARAKNNKRLALLGLHYKEGRKTCFGCFGDDIRNDEVMFLMAYLNDSYAYNQASARLQKKFFVLKP